MSAVENGNVTSGQYVSGVTLQNKKLVITKATDKDTWKQNTRINEGYVTKGDGQSRKVWGTDSSGNPGWRTPFLNEAYLEWGGKNFVSSYGPIDAAMIPSLGANRLAMGSNSASAVDVEYSIDGGDTWSSYSVSDTSKASLFNFAGTRLYIGGKSEGNVDKTKHMVRVTINTSAATIYTVLNKFAIYCSTNGSQGCYCTITARTQQNKIDKKEIWVSFADHISISGWSGWNIINLNNDLATYGNTPSQYGQVRFTFGVTSHKETPHHGLEIIKILGFGGVGWETPSNLALNGSLFRWDGSLNAYFPKGIKVNCGDKCDNTGVSVATIKDVYEIKDIIKKTTAEVNNDASTASQPVEVSIKSDGSPHFKFNNIKPKFSVDFSTGYLMMD